MALEFRVMLPFLAMASEIQGCSEGQPASLNERGASKVQGTQQETSEEE